VNGAIQMAAASLASTLELRQLKPHIKRRGGVWYCSSANDSRSFVGRGSCPRWAYFSYKSLLYSSLNTFGN
jgi:hypothetical protein